MTVDCFVIKKGKIMRAMESRCENITRTYCNKKRVIGELLKVVAVSVLLTTSWVLVAHCWLDVGGRLEEIHHSAFGKTISNVGNNLRPIFIVPIKIVAPFWDLIYKRSISTSGLICFLVEKSTIFN